MELTIEQVEDSRIEAMSKYIEIAGEYVKNPTRELAVKSINAIEDVLDVYNTTESIIPFDDKSYDVIDTMVKTHLELKLLLVHQTCSEIV